LATIEVSGGAVGAAFQAGAREREADAKSPRVRPLMIKTKQHVKLYVQSATDEPFLNRVPQVRISPIRRE
jgi:hypothetical protein